MPDIPPVRIVATGMVGWPPPDEMRKIIEEKLLTMTDAELLEFYKLVCESQGEN
jgi:hypothetical protein